jgi:hypothetical protein
MHPLFSITSIGVCLVASVDLARCDEQSPRLAFSRELELLDQQSKVDGESADQLFTIKIFKKTNVGGEPRFVHLICESLGDKAAVIVLSDAGEPYAYLGNEGVYVISAESAQTLFWYPGLHFRLGIVDPEHFLKLNFSGKLERSACQFDIFRWGHALLGMIALQVTLVSRTFMNSIMKVVRHSKFGSMRRASPNLFLGYR